MDRGELALFNATDLVDNNPGCRATMLCLRNQLKGEIVYEFPLGFGYNYFNIKSFFLNKNKRFSKGFSKVESNVDLIKKIENVDYVIINSEGTIHSDSLGAKTLLSFAKLAKQVGKKVFLVNGSYYNLSDKLLDIIKSCDKVYVREKVSFDYLINKNINAELVLDCAFLIKTNHLTNRTRQNVLYTPGVIFNYSKDSTSLLIEHFNTLKKYYAKPVFLQIENSEEDLVALWKKLGGEVIDSTKIEIKKLLELINSFELVVSGRYHILLFSLMCGVDTLPLKSNTNKIIGLYRNFNINTHDLKRFNEVDSFKLEDKIHFRLNIEKIRHDIVMAYDKLFV